MAQNKTEGKERNIDIAWKAIFNKYNIDNHDFDKSPYEITAGQIKIACQNFKKTAQKEVRILCKQDSRKSRPSVFADKGLFLLPVKNGSYKIIKGEGYIDIPEITTPLINYESKLDFELTTSQEGDSEMQHLDFAYASSIIRSFVEDTTLHLTIRGRKYTPQFSFKVRKHEINQESVQVEVDSGYEGKNNIVLVEAKNSETKDTIIRQLYYPYRKWRIHAGGKKVLALFFEKRKGLEGDEYHLWEFQFEDENNYNSIKLKKSARYLIKP